MVSIENETAHNDSITLWCCLSYGGHAEIVASARAIVASGEEITEESITKHLWTAGMPNPDIIIRPGGEKRLSGFLTWQSVYSELFFIDPFWPEFGEKELDAVLVEYAERERRHGK
jgi:undecaprenyl diphosphate synthase